MDFDKWKISPEKQTAIIKWFEEHGPNGSPECPVCRHTDWMLAEYLVKVDIVTPGQNFIGGVPSYPLVQFICSNCGCAQFLNAVICGAQPLTEAPKNGE